MANRFVHASVLLNVFLACAIIYCAFSSRYTSSLQTKFPPSTIPDIGEGSSARKYAIAVIIPASHKALEEIQLGFENTLTRHYGLKCAFTTCNANGNRTFLRSIVEEVAQSPFDAVFTVGAIATQVTKEVFEKKKVEKPIIFGAVADPVRLGLVNSLKSSENWLTGSAATTNYPLQIALLLYLKPAVKNVLLVYDPTQSSGLERDKREVEKLFAKRGVKFRAVEVYNVHDVQQKLPLVINGELDVVMVLKDNTVVSCMDQVITLCERYRTTLFATDLDSVSKGAGLGFGVKEFSFGTDAAGRAFEVLAKNKHPRDVPVVMTDEFRLVINDSARSKQNLVIDSALYMLLRSVRVMKT